MYKTNRKHYIYAPSLELRLQLAQSNITNRQVLVKLSFDMNDEVREAVAANSRTPVNALVKLAQDIRVRVQMAVLNNPATPKGLLQVMLKEDNRNLQNAIRALSSNSDLAA